jgi:transcriptional regulator with XRE-family HTH domain
MVVRAARVKRGWRQRDLARAVHVSDATISRVERGHLDAVSLGTLRKIALGLDIRVELLPRSRSASVDRLVNALHAELAESVVRWLDTFGGWVVRPEVSFSRFGERGIVDLLAWHPDRRALLVIELKSAIIDVGELLGTLDRKIRNAWEIGRGLGWDPVTVACVLIVAEGPTNRRRVEAHAATFRASLPDRIVRFRRWLQSPTSDLRALVFFADRHQGQVIQRFDHRQRVTAVNRRRVKGRANVVELDPKVRTRSDQRQARRDRPVDRPDAI